jgi:hypothetical protein
MAAAIYRLGELALVRRILVLSIMPLLLPVAIYLDLKERLNGYA